VAVGNAGALGSLGVGLMPALALTATIAAIRAGTDGPFHVNFITGFTGPDQLDAVCEARPAAVSFHWGHPVWCWSGSPARRRGLLESI
jgi:NAD(P)H-dependent flavin oxidoreductase YrpB (nitropropane dioxygenase family)